MVDFSRQNNHLLARSPVRPISEFLLVCRDQKARNRNSTHRSLLLSGNGLLLSGMELPLCGKRLSLSGIEGCIRGKRLSCRRSGLLSCAWCRSRTGKSVPLSGKRNPLDGIAYAVGTGRWCRHDGDLIHVGGPKDGWASVPHSKARRRSTRIHPDKVMRSRAELSRKAPFQ